MKTLHYGRGLVTNAQHNRKQAVRLYDAGFSVDEMVKEFPMVFYKDKDGKMGQKYDSIYQDGETKETKYSISINRVDEMIQDRKTK